MLLMNPKKVMEIQSKVNAVFNEIDSFASNYKTLEKENQSINC